MVLRDFFHRSSSRRLEGIEELNQNNLHAQLGQRDGKHKLAGNKSNKTSIEHRCICNIFEREGPTKSQFWERAHNVYIYF